MKPGDKLVCVNNDGQNYRLTEGKEYEFVEFTDKTYDNGKVREICIAADDYVNRIVWYKANRFEFKKVIQWNKEMSEILEEECL